MWRISLPVRFSFHFFFFTELECLSVPSSTASFGGRNRKCAEAFIRSGKSFDQLEAEVRYRSLDFDHTTRTISLTPLHSSQLLNGQKLQGTVTAEEIYKFLQGRGRVDACSFSRYPPASASNLLTPPPPPPLLVLSSRSSVLQSLSNLVRRIGSQRTFHRPLIDLPLPTVHTISTKSHRIQIASHL